MFDVPLGHFLLLNLGTRFCFKGEGYNTLCLIYMITLIMCLRNLKSFWISKSEFNFEVSRF
jgi:hypothetical protein